MSNQTQQTQKSVSEVANQQTNPEDLIQKAKTGEDVEEVNVPSVVGMAGWDSIDQEQAKRYWSKITASAPHKITACIKAVEGQVDNPGEFCGLLATKAGYDQNG